MSSGIILSGDTKVIVNSLTPAKKLRFLGAGVSVVDNPVNGTFDITVSGGGGGGTITAVANVGSGTGTVYRDITATTINLKTLLAGSNITLTNNADDITIASAAGTGEANTASNLAGTAGAVGVFKSKVGVDLQFKKINAGSSKVTITDDTGNNDVDVDVAEANLTLANQAGTIGNSKISDLAYSKLTSVPTTFAPSSHATTHQSGGSDAIALDTLAAPTDIATLNADTSKHGLLRKLDANVSHYMDGTGNWSVPVSGTGTPIAKGTATKSGDASTKVFNIVHSMATLPVYADVVPTSIDALGSYVITMDATNITITYQVAPPSGTNNLTYEWIAMDINGGGGAGLPAGESNTASNVGSGSGWFKSKTGVDLAFKSLVLGSSKLGVTSNTNDLTLDVTEANLTLSNLGGSVTKAQIPAAAVYTDQTNTFGAFAQLFPNSQLKIKNPAATFSYIIASSAIAADRTLTLPLLAGNDTLVTEAFAQTLTNKTIAAGSNTVTGIVDANISAHTTSKITTTTKALLNSAIVYNDQANTYGAFAQTYPTSQLKILNPAATFSYILASAAIAADRTLTLPLLAGNDTLVTEAFAQTLTNKTLAAGSNTITGIVDANISAHTTSKITTTTKGLLNSAIVYNDQINTFAANDQVIPSTNLKLSNSGFKSTLSVGTLGADTTLTLPSVTETIVGRATTDTLTNKTIAVGSNTVTGIVDANISAHTTSKITTTTKALLNSALVYNDQANTYGVFAQIYPNSQLKIQNPAATFNYIIASSAIAADRTLTLPLLTGNDVAVTEAFTQTLTNKTLVAASNTITDTSAATGDILRHNGTRFVRLARGSANQVLTTNAGATDIAWATATGGFTEAKGTSTQSGNASTLVFNIAHGLGGTPTFATAVAQSVDAEDDFYVTADGTNIIITYPFPPPNVASNLVWFWRAAL